MRKTIHHLVVLKDFGFDAFIVCEMGRLFWLLTLIIGTPGSETWIFYKIFILSIRSYDFEAKTESTIIQENSQIMYFVVDRNERFCLVTTKTEGIRLWCLKTYNLIRTFLGASHNEFVSEIDIL
jgi:hypothetical protein